MAYSELANWNGGSSSPGSYSASISRPPVAQSSAPNSHSKSTSKDTKKGFLFRSVRPTASPSTKNSMSTMDAQEGEMAIEDEMDEVEDVVFAISSRDEVEDSEGEEISAVVKKKAGSSTGRKAAISNGIQNGVKDTKALHKLDSSSSPLTELTEESDMIETPVPQPLKRASFIPKAKSLITQNASSSKSDLKGKTVDKKRGKERSPSLPDILSSQTQSGSNSFSETSYSTLTTATSIASSKTLFSSASIVQSLSQPKNKLRSPTLQIHSPTLSVRSMSPPSPRLLVRLPPTPPPQRTIDTCLLKPSPSLPEPNVLVAKTGSEEPIDAGAPHVRQVLDFVLVPPFPAPYTRGSYKWVGGPQGMYCSSTSSDASSPAPLRDDQSFSARTDKTRKRIGDVVSIADSDDEDRRSRSLAKSGWKGKGKATDTSGRYRLDDSLSRFRSASHSQSRPRKGSRGTASLAGSYTPHIVRRGKNKKRDASWDTTADDKSVSAFTVSSSNTSEFLPSYSYSTKKPRRNRSSGSRSFSRSRSRPRIHPSPSSSVMHKSSSNKKRKQTEDDDDESIVELVENTETTYCHQCRRKSVHDKMRCTKVFEDGDKCGLRFCARCITYRYPHIKFDSYPSVFVCPKCKDTCNCTACCAKRGEKYVSSGRGKNTVRIDVAMAQLGMRGQSHPAKPASPSAGPSNRISVELETQPSLVIAERAKVTKSKSKATPRLAEMTVESWVAERMAVFRDKEGQPKRKRPRFFIGAVQEHWFRPGSTQKATNVVGASSTGAGPSQPQHNSPKISITQMDGIDVGDSQHNDSSSSTNKGKSRSQPTRRLYIGDISRLHTPSTFSSLEEYAAHSILVEESNSAYIYDIDSDGNEIRRSKRARKPSNRMKDHVVLFGSDFGDYDDEYVEEYSWERTPKSGKGKKKGRGEKATASIVDGLEPQFTTSGSGRNRRRTSMTPVPSQDDVQDDYLVTADSASPVHHPTYTMDIEEAHHHDSNDQYATSNVGHTDWPMPVFSASADDDFYNPLQPESSSHADKHPLQSPTDFNITSHPLSQADSSQSHLGMKMSDLFHGFDIAEPDPFPLNDALQIEPMETAPEFAVAGIDGFNDIDERMDDMDMPLNKRKSLSDSMTQEDVSRALSLALVALQS